MTWVYIAAMFGIFRFRDKRYWKGLGILFLWMLAAGLLFSANGKLEDPSGDGLITRHVRNMTGGGGPLVLFGVVALILQYGVAIVLARRLWLIGRDIKAEEQLGTPPSADGASMARKAVEALLATAFVAGWLYIFVALPELARLTGPDAGSEMPRAAAPSSVAADLAELASVANRETPKQIDAITRLVRVTSKDNILIQHFVVSQSVADRNALRAKLLAQQATGLCKEDDVLSALRDNGVVMRFSYVLPDSPAPLDVDVTLAACRSLGLDK